jgi:hypothetical protein
MKNHEDYLLPGKLDGAWKPGCSHFASSLYHFSSSDLERELALLSWMNPAASFSLFRNKEVLQDGDVLPMFIPYVVLAACIP